MVGAVLYALDRDRGSTLNHICLTLGYDMPQRHVARILADLCRLGAVTWRWDCPPGDIPRRVYYLSAGKEPPPD